MVTTVGYPKSYLFCDLKLHANFQNFWNACGLGLVTGLKMVPLQVLMLPPVRMNCSKKSFFPSKFPRCANLLIS